MYGRGAKMTMKKSEEFPHKGERTSLSPPVAKRVSTFPLSFCAAPMDSCKQCRCQPADFRWSKTVSSRQKDTSGPRTPAGSSVRLPAIRDTRRAGAVVRHANRLVEDLMRFVDV